MMSCTTKITLDILRYGLSQNKLDPWDLKNYQWSGIGINRKKRQLLRIIQIGINTAVGCVLGYNNLLKIIMEVNFEECIGRGRPREKYRILIVKDVKELKELREKRKFWFLRHFLVIAVLVIFLLFLTYCNKYWNYILFT